MNNVVDATPAPGAQIDPDAHRAPDVRQRPVWRGRLHQVALIAAVPLLLAMLLSAPSGRAIVAISLYAFGLIATFGTSALYHRFPHKTARQRATLQRADHATIFLGIAGTNVPLCLLGLPAGWGIPLLAVVSTGALVGISCALRPSRKADAIAETLYIALGWSAVVALPAMIIYRGWLPGLLILGGGLFYTVGALLFSKEIPRLAPRVFGYHEVWHAFTIAAAGCHLAAVWVLLERA